jgi:CheY-specific phosphatase CheX
MPYSAATSNIALRLVPGVQAWLKQCFEKMGPFEVDVRPLVPLPARRGDGDVAVVVGLGGALPGVVQVSCSRLVAAEVARNVFGEGAPTAEQVLQTLTDLGRRVGDTVAAIAEAEGLGAMRPGLCLVVRGPRQVGTGGECDSVTMPFDVDGGELLVTVALDRMACEAPRWLAG